MHAARHAALMYKTLLHRNKISPSFPANLSSMNSSLSASCGGRKWAGRGRGGQGTVRARRRQLRAHELPECGDPTVTAPRALEQTHTNHVGGQPHHARAHSHLARSQRLGGINLNCPTREPIRHENRREPRGHATEGPACAPHSLA